MTHDPESGARPGNNSFVEPSEPERHDIEFQPEDAPSPSEVVADEPIGSTLAQTLGAERMVLGTRSGDRVEELCPVVPGATPTFTVEDWQDLMRDVANFYELELLGKRAVKRGEFLASSRNLRALADALPSLLHGEAVPTSPILPTEET